MTDRLAEIEAQHARALPIRHEDAEWLIEQVRATQLALAETRIGGIFDEFRDVLEEYASLREEYQGPAAYKVVPVVGAALDKVLALFEGAQQGANPAQVPADATSATRRDWRYGYLRASENTAANADILSEDLRTAMVRVESCLTTLGSKGSAGVWLENASLLAVRFVLEALRASTNHAPHALSVHSQGGSCTHGFPFGGTGCEYCETFDEARASGSSLAAAHLTAERATRPSGTVSDEPDEMLACIEAAYRSGGYGSGEIIMLARPYFDYVLNVALNTPARSLAPQGVSDEDKKRADFSRGNDGWLTLTIAGENWVELNSRRMTAGAKGGSE